MMFSVRRDSLHALNDRSFVLSVISEGLLIGFNLPNAILASFSLLSRWMSGNWIVFGCTEVTASFRNVLNGLEGTYELQLKLLGHSIPMCGQIKRFLKIFYVLGRNMHKSSLPIVVFAISPTGRIKSWEDKKWFI